jgi:hypothetical protein
LIIVLIQSPPIALTPERLAQKNTGISGSPSESRKCRNEQSASGNRKTVVRSLQPRLARGAHHHRRWPVEWNVQDFVGTIVCTQLSDADGTHGPPR